jgi:hypothetical protein
LVDRGRASDVRDGGEHRVTKTDREVGNEMSTEASMSNGRI